MPRGSRTCTMRPRGWRADVGTEQAFRGLGDTAGGMPGTRGAGAQVPLRIFRSCVLSILPGDGPSFSPVHCALGRCTVQP